MRLLLSAFCLGIPSVTWASSSAQTVTCLLWLFALQILTAIFVAVSRSAFIGVHESRIAYFLAVSAAFGGGALFHAQTAENQLSRQLAPVFGSRSLAHRRTGVEYVERSQEPHTASSSA